MEAAGYSPDLAYIHDSGFTHVAEEAANIIVKILQAGGMYSGKIVELGCGSGTAACIFLSAGYEVYGVEISESMIKLAREKNSEGSFMLASLWDVTIPSCTAVVSIGECLNYEFDGEVSLKKVRNLFSRVFDALKPNGLFVFDVLCEGSVEGDGITKNFTEGKDWLVAVERSETYNAIQRRIISFVSHQYGYKRTLEVHRVTKFNIEEIEQLLRDTGFYIEIDDAYGEKSFGPNHKVFRAIGQYN